MVLQQSRDRIDQIDMQIIDLLAQRFAMVKTIGEYKRMHGIPPLDDVRWNQVLMSVIAIAKQKGLSESLARDLRERIHQESLSLQETKKPA